MKVDWRKYLHPCKKNVINIWVISVKVDSGNAKLLPISTPVYLTITWVYRPYRFFYTDLFYKPPTIGRQIMHCLTSKVDSFFNKIWRQVVTGIDDQRMPPIKEQPRVLQCSHYQQFRRTASTIKRLEAGAQMAWNRCAIFRDAFRQTSISLQLLSGECAERPPSRGPGGGSPRRDLRCRLSRRGANHFRHYCPFQI